LKAVRALLSSERPVDGAWIEPKTTAEREHYWLAFHNGVLDMTALANGESPEPVACSPRWFSGVVLPYDYSPGMPCPAFTGAFPQWMDGDRARGMVVQEFAGYCLCPSTKHQVALFLEGPGGNGKGTFTMALQAMLGKDNWAGLALNTFGEKFEPADALGKLVNFSAETKKGRGALPIEMIKALISGDAQTFSRKYQQGITCRPTARLVVSWNERPVIDDPTHAFWRRMLLVPFTREFSTATRDEDLEDSWVHEAPGIFNWAVTGLQRLTDQGKFTVSSTVSGAVSNYKSESNPLPRFIRERLRVSAGSTLLKSYLFEVYLDWCDELDLVPTTKSRLGRALREAFPRLGIKRLGSVSDRVHLYDGIALSKETTP
jgi:putative DNA primase/helicase